MPDCAVDVPPNTTPFINAAGIHVKRVQQSAVEEPAEEELLAKPARRTRRESDRDRRDINRRCRPPAPRACSRPRADAAPRRRRSGPAGMPCREAAPSRWRAEARAAQAELGRQGLREPFAASQMRIPQSARSWMSVAPHVTSRRVASSRAPLRQQRTRRAASPRPARRRSPTAGPRIRNQAGHGGRGTCAGGTLNAVSLGAGTELSQRAERVPDHPRRRGPSRTARMPAAAGAHRRRACASRRREDTSPGL